MGHESRGNRCGVNQLLLFPRLCAHSEQVGGEPRGVGRAARVPPGDPRGAAGHAPRRPPYCRWATRTHEALAVALMTVSYHGGFPVRSLPAARCGSRATVLHITPEGLPHAYTRVGTMPVHRCRVPAQRHRHVFRGRFQRLQPATASRRPGRAGQRPRLCAVADASKAFLPKQSHRVGFTQVHASLCARVSIVCAGCGRQNGWRVALCAAPTAVSMQWKRAHACVTCHTSGRQRRPSTTTRCLRGERAHTCMAPAERWGCPRFPVAAPAAAVTLPRLRMQQLQRRGRRCGMCRGAGTGGEAWQGCFRRASGAPR